MKNVIFKGYLKPRNAEKEELLVFLGKVGFMQKIGDRNAWFRISQYRDITLNDEIRLERGAEDPTNPGYFIKTSLHDPAQKSEITILVKDTIRLNLEREFSGRFELSHEYAQNAENILSPVLQ